MDEPVLTPHFAARQAQLRAGISEQSDDDVTKALHPAEFERRYGQHSAYVEKSLSALSDSLVSKGLDDETAQAVVAEALPLQQMTRVLVGTPAGTQAVFVDTRPEADQLASLALLTATVDAAAVAQATTEQELEKAVGAANIYSDDSFSALRHASIEKGMRPGDADDFIEKSRDGLTKKSVTDRNGHQVSRWVKTGAKEPAFMAMGKAEYDGYSAGKDAAHHEQAAKSHAAAHLAAKAAGHPAKAAEHKQLQGWHEASAKAKGGAQGGANTPMPKEKTPAQHANDRDAHKDKAEYFHGQADSLAAAGNDDTAEYKALRARGDAHANAGKESHQKAQALPAGMAMDKAEYEAMSKGKDAGFHVQAAHHHAGGHAKASADGHPAKAAEHKKLQGWHEASAKAKAKK